jgi:GNAT superfamily N-acetyltransferase
MTFDSVSMSEFRAIFGENEWRSTSAEYYKWKIYKNPYLQGNIFLERRQAIVTGSATVTPKKVAIGEREYIAAESGDTFTHPEYRRQGIFSNLLNACFEFANSRGIGFVYGTPNSQSLPGAQKLGYLPCPFVKLNYLTKNPRILVPALKSYAKSILRRKLNPADVSSQAKLKQKVSQIFSGPKGSADKGSFDISMVDEFTDEIDGLWGRPRYIFFTVRDKTYLNWRYFENPDKYQVIVSKKGAEYLGYVVTKLSKNGKAATICDFVTVDDRLDVFHALIKQAEKMLKKAKINFIQTYCVENSPYYQAWLEQGYYDPGPDRRQPIIVYSGTELGRTLLNTEGKWHFTISDSDNI